jgi:hypothetical protein
MAAVVLNSKRHIHHLSAGLLQALLVLVLVLVLVLDLRLLL